jgi:hypothetical protein
VAVAVAVAVPMTIAVPMAIAVAVAPAVAVADATVAVAVAALRITLPAGITAIRPAAGLSPALALAPSATISIVVEVVTAPCQSIARSYLPGQLGKGAPYSLEERQIFDRVRGFIYRGVEGSTCHARRFRGCRVVVSRRFKSRSGTHSSLKWEISLQWRVWACVDFKSRTGLRAHPAGLTGSQFSQRLSIEAENQNPALIHEHFRSRSVYGNQKSRSFTTVEKCGVWTSKHRFGALCTS